MALVAGLALSAGLLSACAPLFELKDQGFVKTDSIGNIEARLTDNGIRDDKNITKDSVFLLYVYNRGAILSKERALEETGQWGCPHGSTLPVEEEANPTADSPDGDTVNTSETTSALEAEEPTANHKDFCMEGLGFSNDPGFFVLEFQQAFDKARCEYEADKTDDNYNRMKDVEERLLDARSRHPTPGLNTAVNQWTFSVFSTDSYEVPSVYLVDYNHFQSLTTPRDEDEQFDAYMAVYYKSPELAESDCDVVTGVTDAAIPPGSPFTRNQIVPDKISPKIEITTKFTAEGPDDLPGNIYPIPDYDSWVSDLYNLE